MKEELCRLAMAFGIGGGAGILYDLLRPLRRKLGDRTGALLDILFCLLSNFAAFLFAMSADSGRLGIWELTAALLGFLLYLNTLSPPVFRVFSDLFGAVFGGLGLLRKLVIKLIKKMAIFRKNVFKFVRKCYIIKK